MNISPFYYSLTLWGIDSSFVCALLYKCLSISNNQKYGVHRIWIERLLCDVHLYRCMGIYRRYMRFSII